MVGPYSTGGARLATSTRLMLSWQRATGEGWRRGYPSSGTWAGAKSVLVSQVLRSGQPVPEEGITDHKGWHCRTHTDKFLNKHWSSIPAPI
jgi:hypothetical protein